jgi:hypothetical protein
VVAAASAGAGFLAGKDSVPLPAPVVATEPEAPPKTAPTVAEVTLARADIIRLANGAADAASGGLAVEDMMDGRRFVIRIPFGCGPLTDRDVDQGASFAVEDQTLRVRVLPENWTDLPWVASELSRRDAVGAEGFWIPRPWTRAEACAPGESDPTDTSSSLGIAQLFDSESSRVGQRRGPALEATVQLDAGDPSLDKGLRLVIEGRVVRWPGGRETVLCHAAKAYERPVCLVGTKLDSISIENAADGDRLADWRF